MNWIFAAGGLVLLVVGAEWLVRAASTLGQRLGISSLVIGLTVVAFGTSAPELAVSVQSALDGRSAVALGNVVGSNVFNVLFILGLSALITPLVVDARLIRQEVPWLIGVSALVMLLALDRRIGAGDGLLLCALLAVYTLLQLRAARRVDDAGEVPVAKGSVPLIIGGAVAGLALLVWGADIFVSAAIAIARDLGVSEVTIGLTIIAAGTSLPEVATSIVAAVRGERDIAVGNVVGSNLFNLMGVAGIAALVAPGGLEVAPSILAFDLPVMLVVAVACLPVFFSAGRIDRWEGGVFFCYYLAYTAYLVLYTKQHDMLDDFQLAMVWVVMPLTVVTAIAIYLYGRRR